MCLRNRLLARRFLFRPSGLLATLLQMICQWRNGEPVSHLEPSSGRTRNIPSRKVMKRTVKGKMMTKKAKGKMTTKKAKGKMTTKKAKGKMTKLGKMTRKGMKKTTLPTPNRPSHLMDKPVLTTIEHEIGHQLSTSEHFISFASCSSSVSRSPPLAYTHIMLYAKPSGDASRSFHLSCMYISVKSIGY